MRLKHTYKLVIFETIARNLSFTGAAAELGLAKGTVSLHLASLEEELGIKLLNRGSRSVSLTADGEALLPHCTQLVEAANATFDLALNETREPTGPISITSSHNMALTYLSDALIRFRELYPKIQTALLVREGFVNLVEEGVDVALRAGNMDDSNLIMRRIGSFRTVVCAAPSYLKKFDPIRTPDDLEQMDWVSISLINPSSRISLSTHGNRRATIRVNTVATTNSGLVALDTIIRGGGIGLLPDFAIGDGVAKGALATPLPDWWERENPLSLVWTPLAKRKHRTRLLIDYLIKDFNNRSRVPIL